MSAVWMNRSDTLTIVNPQKETKIAQATSRSQVLYTTKLHEFLAYFLTFCMHTWPHALRCFPASENPVKCISYRK